MLISVHPMGVISPNPYAASIVAAAFVIIADHIMTGAGKGRFQK